MGFAGLLLPLVYRPEVRLFVDKAIQDYRLWNTGESETHWRDLVTSSIQERLVRLTHESRPVGRADMIQAERAMAQQINSTHGTRAAKLAAWRAQTGKSERAFYRRLTAA